MLFQVSFYAIMSFYNAFFFGIKCIKIAKMCGFELSFDGNGGFY